MEDRVKTILEKEHSKRFREMCLRNEGLAQENKTLQEFYDREKKKSLHGITMQESQLHKKLLTFSQERFVNGLVNKLTDMAFSNSNVCKKSIVKTIESLTSLEDEDEERKLPRYLRMETNAMHGSDVSLGSDTLECESSSINNITDNEKQLENNLASQNKDGGLIQDKDNREENVNVKNEDMSKNAVKTVVDKLTGFYDIEKLKMISQVMLKTMQTNERSRCEEKVKLLNSLNRYLNGGEQAKSASPCLKTSNESISKTKGNDTFLFLKADRQKELRDEAERATNDKKSAKHRNLKTSIHTKKAFSLPAISCQTEIDKLPDRRLSLPTNIHNTSALHDKSSAIVEESSSTEFNDMMKIYLKLGHGSGLLKLPDNTSRAIARAKQKSWLRKDLRKIPVVPKNGIQDLRVVMKNCRYLRFPRDMKQDPLY